MFALTRFGDWWQDLLKEDAEQLAPFGAAPVLGEFCHERVSCGQYNPFSLHAPS